MKLLKNDIYLHLYIQLQSAAKEKEWSSMHITVSTSDEKLQYTMPMLTSPESPDDWEWTVKVDPVSSVNTSESPSEEFIHVVYSLSKVYRCRLH